MTQQNEQQDKDLKFLKAFHKIYRDYDTRLFHIEEHLLLVTRFLARTGETFCYLNKDTFQKLYPVLEDIVIPEKKVSLIVHSSVLEDMNAMQVLSFPYLTDPEQEDYQKPSLSRLLNKKSVFTSDETLNEAPIPSFILFNNRSYIIEGESTGFICAPNAAFSPQQAERLDAFYHFFSVLKSNSTPLLEAEKTKITSHPIVMPSMPKPFSIDLQKE